MCFHSYKFSDIDTTAEWDHFQVDLHAAVAIVLCVSTFTGTAGAARVYHRVPPQLALAQNLVTWRRVLVKSGPEIQLVVTAKSCTTSLWTWDVF